MKLTEKLVSGIIREVNDIVKQKINIMNEKGIIIASTDKERIGELHLGAKEIIDNGLDEIIVRYDGEFKGAKCGVNYPITIMGETYGVLGITGDYHAIESNAKIIKKLTELMLLNDYTRMQKSLGEIARNRYVEEWLTGEHKNIALEFIEQGRMFNIDITIPRRFIACSVYAHKNHNISLEMIDAINKIEDQYIQFVKRMSQDNIYYRDQNSNLT